MLLGYDIGSSSVKASLVDTQTGRTAASAFYPKSEAPITSLRPGWAEQDPEMWWQNLKLVTADVLSQQPGAVVEAIGISYQMHGLVCVGRDLKPLRPAIIWCDSRAVSYGAAAFEGLGGDWCLGHLLNSPGNFTAAKLAWVRQNEPDIYSSIYKIMLPGDYIALRLTGTAATTVSGLSEGMLWDFAANRPAQELMRWFGFDGSLIPDIVPTFGRQGEVSAAAATELGLPAGVPVCYRAGDQPNNALSLGVLNPGEIAATAGTSGVVYGVCGKVNYDPQSRVNTFAHVNHSAADPRLGILLCINGTGILNSWLKHNVVPDGLSYDQMNEVAASISVGCEGLSVLPFGNGAERMLGNREVGCRVCGLDFNRHSWKHLVRAGQEGIAFAFASGMRIMQDMGMEIKTIRAGKANMFLSPVFRSTIANATGATIELYDTDGAAGAARGAGMGAGIYSGAAEAFSTLEKLGETSPDNASDAACREAFGRWCRETENIN